MTPLPAAEVTVGELRRWLSYFTDDAVIAMQDGDGRYVAPEIEFGRGVREIVPGHYKAEPEGGLYFVSLRPRTGR